MSSCNTSARRKIKALVKPDENHLHFCRSQRQNNTLKRERGKKSRAQKKHHKERVEEPFTERGNRTNISPIRTHNAFWHIRKTRVCAAAAASPPYNSLQRAAAAKFVSLSNERRGKEILLSDKRRVFNGEREREASYIYQPPTQFFARF
jgi:hypothetical protein